MSSVRMLDEYPLPLEQHEVDEFVDDHPYLRDVDWLHVDELNDDYVDTLARNGEWWIFQCHLLGSGTYVWNHAIGGGFCIEEEESFWMLADAFKSYFDSKGVDSNE